MNIKVCGITTLKQLQQLDGLEVDYAGLIFHKDSPRYVGDKLPGEEIKNADFELKKVGVFVNPELIDVLDAIDNYGLEVVQLHGEETPEMCDDLSTEVEVIKVFSIGPDTKDIDKLVADYDAVCDFYLFDTADADAKGGTGKSFDWSIFKKAKIEKPFFLSGGIGPDDAAKVAAFSHPDYFGIDINSRFETAPGVKDMASILKFKQALKR